MDIANLKKTLEASVRGMEQLTSHTPEKIETTARQLEKIGYSPMLIIPVENFIRYTKDDVIREMKKTTSLDESEMAALGFTDGSEHDARKAQQLSLLKYFFSLISRLRDDDPEAWNEVSELYQDD